jgi:hypothetical protein
MGNDFGEHPRLSDPSGDQLGVLRAEIDHQHWTRGSCLHGFESIGHEAGGCARAFTLSRPGRGTWQLFGPGAASLYDGPGRLLVDDIAESLNAVIELDDPDPAG